MSDEALLPNNATPQEQAIEASTARLAGVPVPIRDLWNPDTCPVDLLPYLAWALSLDAWKSYWPESVKRQRIRDAIAIQRKKGTAQSVRSAVASFGSSVALREWWQKTPKGDPHTFEVTLTLGGNAPGDGDFQADIINEINRTKPVRSHFTLTAGLSASGGVGVQGVARTLTYKRLTLTESSDPAAPASAPGLYLLRTISGENAVWQEFTEDISQYANAQNARLVFEYENGPDEIYYYRGDLQLDAVDFDGDFSSFEGSGQDWETSAAGELALDDVLWLAIPATSDSLKWNIESGNTISTGTGLASAADGNYYLYAETSGPSSDMAGAKFWLRSPAKALGSNPSLSYSVARYGDNIGTLKVYLEIL